LIGRLLLMVVAADAAAASLLLHFLLLLLHGDQIPLPIVLLDGPGIWQTLGLTGKVNNFFGLNSILASRPAAPGSIHGVPTNLSRII